MAEKADKKLYQNIEKVTINVGTGRMSQQADFNNKILPEIEKELAMITGQKPQRVKSKVAISGFKLRIGQVIGVKITLRGAKAVDFIHKIVNIVLPRIKDFRGLSPKVIDKGGVLNIGIKDKNIFPEILPEQSNVSFGLQISVVPKKKDREKQVEVYKALKVPVKHG